MNPSDIFAILTDLKAEQERLSVGAQRVQDDHFMQFSECQVGMEHGLILTPIGAGTPVNPFMAEQPAAAGWPRGMQVRLCNHLEAMTVRQTADTLGMDAHLAVTEEGFIASTLVWAELDLDRKGLSAGYHVLRETMREATTLGRAFTALRAEIDDLLALDNPFEAVGPPVSESDLYAD